MADGADLPSLPCVGVHATRRRDRWPLVAEGQVRWLDVEPFHWADDVGAVIALAVAGLGVTLMAEFLVEEEVATGQLVQLTEPGMAMLPEVFVILGYE